MSFTGDADSFEQTVIDQNKMIIKTYTGRDTRRKSTKL